MDKKSAILLSLIGATPAMGMIPTNEPATVRKDSRNLLPNTEAILHQLYDEGLLRFQKVNNQMAITIPKHLVSNEAISALTASTETEILPNGDFKLVTPFSVAIIKSGALNSRLIGNGQIKELIELQEELNPELSNGWELYLAMSFMR